MKWREEKPKVWYPGSTMSDEMSRSQKRQAEKQRAQEQAEHVAQQAPYTGPVMSPAEAREREQGKREHQDQLHLRDKLQAARASVVQAGSGWFVPDGDGKGEGFLFDDYDVAVAIAERRTMERAQGRSGYGLTAGGKPAVLKDA